MTTSQTFSLSKPTEGEPIRVPTLAYLRARHKRKLHSLVLAEFKKSGITQAELCRRLRKDAATVSRLLGEPGNWRLDTVSDLLFAISGAEPTYGVDYPLDKPARNFTGWDQLFTQSRGSTAGLPIKSIKATGDKFELMKDAA